MGGESKEASPDRGASGPDDRRSVGLILTGGGARAAYQVGMLRCLGRHYPEYCFDIVTGVSAGAINAAYLASHPGCLADAVEELSELWLGLDFERVFHIDRMSLWLNVYRWGRRLLSGGSSATEVESLLDTSPLRDLLDRELSEADGTLGGIEEKLERDELHALALVTLDYATGQTVTWIQGRDIEAWERPHRRAHHTEISVDHVMASAALPLVFPAVAIGDSYYGDGGVRLSSPLAPAIHLGADHLLAISTRYPRSRAEAERPAIEGYPPPAQIIGVVLNSVFLDMMDEDALELERVNRLLEHVPGEERGRLEQIELTVLRPSQDLGRLAAEYEERVPGTLGFLTRGLGTRETASPDFLSLLMFQPDYLRRLIEIGEHDAEDRKEELQQVLGV